MSIGKQLRMERIFNRHTATALIVPMDHGISDGPIRGILDIRKTVEMVCDGGATAVIMHKGLVEAGHRGQGRDMGLIIHLSASTNLSPAPNTKRLITTVEEAIQLGADAVSVHVNIGAEDDGQMLVDFGSVVERCRHWGMPLLAMMYPRGKGITNSYDPQLLKHVARVGAEVGADVVKVNYTGDEDSFKEVVRGCPVPVLIAGGPKLDSDIEVLKMTRSAMDAGAKGISIGRNIWQHSNPKRMTEALASIVFNNASLEEAERVLRSK